MRVFKTRHFDKWAKKHAVTAGALCRVVEEIHSGLIDADYGSHLYKKRIATKGRGKSGSVRTLLACRLGQAVYFLYGFEKNERDNIGEQEKKAYKILAKSVLAFSETDIKRKLEEGSLVEVRYEQTD